MKTTHVSGNLVQGPVRSTALSGGSSAFARLVEALEQTTAKISNRDVRGREMSNATGARGKTGRMWLVTPDGSAGWPQRVQNTAREVWSRTWWTKVLAQGPPFFSPQSVLETSLLNPLLETQPPICRLLESVLQSEQLLLRSCDNSIPSVTAAKRQQGRGQIV